MMFILKYYRVFFDKTTLSSFLDKYELDTNSTKFEEVVWTINTRRGVRFPEFIMILIRAGLYIQEEISDTNDEIDIYVSKIFQQIKDTDQNEDEMTEFNKHMRFNSELIQLLNDLSENLLYIYAYKLRETNERPYCMSKDDVITLIEENDLTGDNFSNLVDLCLNEIVDHDKYSGFNGIFYYEFLQVLQWLSLIYVQSTQEEMEDMEDDNVEITEEALLEKTQYFIENLINNYHAVLEQLIEDDEQDEINNEINNDSIQEDQASDY